MPCSAHSSSYINEIVAPNFVPLPNPSEKTRNSFFQTHFFRKLETGVRARLSNECRPDGRSFGLRPDINMLPNSWLNSTRGIGHSWVNRFWPWNGAHFIQMTVGLVKWRTKLSNNSIKMFYLRSRIEWSYPKNNIKWDMCFTGKTLFSLKSPFNESKNFLFGAINASNQFP